MSHELAASRRGGGVRCRHLRNAPDALEVSISPVLACVIGVG
jgi:hypothetical protein